MEIRPAIGLEVHAQLKTRTKLFCGCFNVYSDSPNTNVCPVCSGYPGTLPVLNRQAIKLALKTALALNFNILPLTQFSRKNYFYPDLPKGYQISQFDLPLATDGYLEIISGGGIKRINLDRLHVEEDAGKLIHSSDNKNNHSFLDFNRTGVPLIEIVTKPVLRSSEDASEFLRTLRTLLRYIGASDSRMEEGGLRCDMNISVNHSDSNLLGTKVEVKNLNSVRYLAQAVQFEIKRQSALLIKGAHVQQETRLWDEENQVTALMRSKEDSDDYRFFTDPDVDALKIEKPLINDIRAKLPELQMEKIIRFIKAYGISLEAAKILTESREMADYFEETVLYQVSPYHVYKWLVNIVKSKLDNRNGICDFPVTPLRLSQLIEMIDNDTISYSSAKNVFDLMIQTGKSAKEIVAEKNLTQISDCNHIAEVIRAVISDNPEMVEEFNRGKKNVFNYFMGQVMARMDGRANPETVNDMLRKRLLYGGF